MRRTYRVLLETDRATGQVCATLSSLNHTSDFGDTVEEALANLETLAQGFLELLTERGERVPPNDSVDQEGVFLSVAPETMWAAAG